MENLLNFFWIWRATPAEVQVADPTHYEVQTHTSIYRGVIVTQDNMVMRLQVANGRPVKILKENIQRISIYEIHPQVR